MNLSGFFLVLVISCSFGWKIDVEPFEKIPMYSSQNLSFKLQMERGISWVLDHLKIKYEILILGDRDYFDNLSQLHVDLNLKNKNSGAVKVLNQRVSFDSNDIR